MFTLVDYPNGNVNKIMRPERLQAHDDNNQPQCCLNCLTVPTLPLCPEPRLRELKGSRHQVVQVFCTERLPHTSFRTWPMGAAGGPRDTLLQVKRKSPVIEQARRAAGPGRGVISRHWIHGIGPGLYTLFSPGWAKRSGGLPGRVEYYLVRSSKFESHFVAPMCPPSTKWCIALPDEPPLHYIFANIFGDRACDNVKVSVSSRNSPAVRRLAQDAKTSSINHNLSARQCGPAKIIAKPC
ncbi:hypothetical protein PoB_006635700 [Plakobranchus ocellatus]|uniref:Uncharacterized protein n=1 Tax=Plakobranchus ocellatus TaxID=259542 RepID=A0AAV4D6U3_9GAST|nr:hypothetical protein PoB_006635700 [Plakobranchus ocellatus]